MTKTDINTFIKHMQKAEQVSKVTPWMVEGIGDVQADVRYIGMKLDLEWQEVFSKENNILLKFVLIKKLAKVEVYLANTPPFFRITTLPFNKETKWETVFGELRRKLKKAKVEYQQHTDSVDNIFRKLSSQLKK